jgi:hypothetical protein
VLQEQNAEGNRSPRNFFKLTTEIAYLLRQCYEYMVYLQITKTLPKVPVNQTEITNLHIYYDRLMNIYFRRAVFYYLASWRRVVIFWCIRRLPSNKTAVDLDRSWIYIQRLPNGRRSCALGHFCDKALLLLLHTEQMEAAAGAEDREVG